MEFLHDHVVSRMMRPICNVSHTVLYIFAYNTYKWRIFVPNFNTSALCIIGLFISLCCLAYTNVLGPAEQHCAIFDSAAEQPYVVVQLCYIVRNLVTYFWNDYTIGFLHHLVEQELSYCQQIVCQLRTQYAEGIYRLKYYTVTLKSRLRITQGHCKRNHWIDHTRFSSSRVIWRWILVWPWNVG